MGFYMIIYSDLVNSRRWSFLSWNKEQQKTLGFPRLGFSLVYCLQRAKSTVRPTLLIYQVIYYHTFACQKNAYKKNSAGHDFWWKYETYRKGIFTSVKPFVVCPFYHKFSFCVSYFITNLILPNDYTLVTYKNVNTKSTLDNFPKW